MTGRMEPRDPAQFDEHARKVAELISPGPDGLPMRHYAVLMQNSWFLERWLRMAGTVMKRSSLRERDKMLVMLRVAYRMRCAYAWTQRQRPDKLELHESFRDVSLHAGPSQVGITEDEIQALTRPIDSYPWEPQEAVLLRACDDSKDHGGISAETWRGLTSYLSKKQLFDLVALIGFYLMDCSMFNSFGVENYAGDPSPPWPPADNGSTA